ncbi:transposase [Burkholderia gladioli]|uniref:transposase n=1 Tax=Burkholderia gladioli TaxID=28095 RepID=UPI0034DAD37E
MSEKSVPKRQYTDEFKIEAVRLAESVGQHEAARRLGVPVATLGNWTRRNLLSSSAPKTGGHDALAKRATRPISELEGACQNFRVRGGLSITRLAGQNALRRGWRTGSWPPSSRARHVPSQP